MDGQEADVELFARRFLCDELRLLVVRIENQVVALLDECLGLGEVLVAHSVHRFEVLRPRVARISNNLHRHHGHIVFRHCIRLLWKNISCLFDISHNC